MRLHEWLIDRAHSQLTHQGRIDMVLHSQLISEGLDTEEIERKFNETNEE